VLGKGADVKPNIFIMNIYAKVKFWSFLVVGVVCIFFGAYLFPYGPDKRPWAELLLLVGAGQLIIFAVLFFLRYHRKSKGTAKA
jgi:ABC-type antimicrobial peptide transport system permease subunit